MFSYEAKFGSCSNYRYCEEVVLSAAPNRNIFPNIAMVTALGTIQSSKHLENAEGAVSHA